MTVMRSIILAAMMLICFNVAHAQKTNKVPESPNGEYGEVVAESLKTYSLDEAIETAETEVRCQLKASVTEVCASEGCWMMIKSDKNEIRVNMKDHDFFVPSSLVGKEVLIQGVLLSETISEEMRRHYAHDAGASEEEIEAIVGDRVEYTFEASGVKVP